MSAYSDEQLAILDVAQNTGDHMVIDALAGTGKTTTLLALLEVLPAASTLLCAFNKRIADELQEKVPPLPPGRMVSVKTLHAVGLGVLRSHFWGLNVEDDASDGLITEAVTEHCLHAGGSGLSMTGRRAAVRLLMTLKETQITPTVDSKIIRVTGEEFGHFDKLDNAKLIDQVVDVVGVAYQAGVNFRQRKQIAFCDMVWGAVVSGVKPKSRYKAVIVDEAQDVSAPQLALIESLLAPNGRLIIAGDLNQAIYGWRGSAGTALWERMRTHYKAKFMPLTTTWRCSQAVVKMANQLVPKLRPRPGAPEGAVRSMNFSDLAKELRQRFEQTFVLSRGNAALLSSALELWKNGVKFTLNAGAEMIDPLFNLLDRLDKTSARAFTASLEAWYVTETKRAETAGSAMWAERCESHYGMLKVAADYAKTPDRIQQLLNDLLRSTRKTSILLSSVHKVKGLEADFVYLLKETFERHKPQRGEKKRTPSQEELNIEYVAITRAKKTLTWVSVDPLLLKIYQWNDAGEKLDVKPTLDGRVAIGTADGDSISVDPMHPVAQAALASSPTAAADFSVDLDSFEEP